MSKRSIWEPENVRTTRPSRSRNRATIRQAYHISLFVTPILCKNAQDRPTGSRRIPNILHITTHIILSMLLHDQQ
ncbi:hypothetical protein ACHAW5_004893 [Stephanodiscus triporus]|uniref:Uncharacterized protein n=1 Tax=Stephanodiscus triporus TaxID=2934178 RepID=A0ABD3PCT9_9STRA